MIGEGGKTTAEAAGLGAGEAAGTHLEGTLDEGKHTSTVELDAPVAGVLQGEE